MAYIIVYVENVRETVSFYEQAFGLERNFIHESGKYAQMSTGATALAFADEQDVPTHSLFVLNRKANKSAGVEVAFTVSNVDAAYAQALNAGAEAAIPPAKKPWGQVVSYVRDCNGLLVELCSAMGG